MGAIHVIPGLEDPTCGIAVAAKSLVRRGEGAEGETWVHSMWTPLVLASSFKALLSGRRLVRMPHGCTDPVKLSHRWWKKRWIAPVERWLFRHADRIIATCEEETGWIKAFEPKVKRIEIVRLGNRVSAFAEATADREHVERVECAGDGLLYIGRLHPLKGVEFLLEAVPQGVRTVIIGKDNGEGEKLREIAARRGIDVDFRGVTSEEEKVSEIGKCRALVLPTLSENFGLVVSEALEAGRRAITTDGAPAWGENLEKKVAAAGDGEIWSACGGMLLYLKGFRDGSRETKIALLRKALEFVV